MKIETERLQLYVLDAVQLRHLADSLCALESELGITYDGEPLRGPFLEYIRTQAGKAEQDGNNYVFHSFWLMVRKADRTAVGMASFKNQPGQAREVEIGYGQNEVYRGNGYMTETVAAMCKWALAHPDVDRVIAETEPANKKSERVLQRAGFEKYKTVGENIWWRIEK